MRLFQKLTDADYVCFTWFERGRSNVRLETPQGRVIFNLWDDAIEEAITDGFLPKPRSPNMNRSNDWQPCAVAYARSQGLIK